MPTFGGYEGSRRELTSWYAGQAGSMKELSTLTSGHEGSAKIIFQHSELKGVQYIGIAGKSTIYLSKNGRDWTSSSISALEKIDDIQLYDYDGVTYCIVLGTYYISGVKGGSGTTYSGGICYDNDIDTSVNFTSFTDQVGNSNSYITSFSCLDNVGIMEYRYDETRTGNFATFYPIPTDTSNKLLHETGKGNDYTLDSMKGITLNSKFYGISTDSMSNSSTPSGTVKIYPMSTLSAMSGSFDAVGSSPDTITNLLTGEEESKLVGKVYINPSYANIYYSLYSVAGTNKNFGYGPIAKPTGLSYNSVDYWLPGGVQLVDESTYKLFYFPSEKTSSTLARNAIKILLVNQYGIFYIVDNVLYFNTLDLQSAAVVATCPSFIPKVIIEDGTRVIATGANGVMASTPAPLLPDSVWYEYTSNITVTLTKIAYKGMSEADSNLPIGIQRLKNLDIGTKIQISHDGTYYSYTLLSTGSTSCLLLCDTVFGDRVTYDRVEDTLRGYTKSLSDVVSSYRVNESWSNGYNSYSSSYYLVLNRDQLNNYNATMDINYEYHVRRETYLESDGTGYYDEYYTVNTRGSVILEATVHENYAGIRPTPSHKAYVRPKILLNSYTPIYEGKVYGD